MTLREKLEAGPTNKGQHNLRLVVMVQVVEVGAGFLSTARDAERIWHHEQVVVPLERVAALDLSAMIDHAIQNVVVIAGQDGKEEK